MKFVFLKESSIVYQLLRDLCDPLCIETIPQCYLLALNTNIDGPSMAANAPQVALSKSAKSDYCVLCALVN